jgi:hypothetical protein
MPQTALDGVFARKDAVTMDEPLSDAELDAIASRASSSTPGPWFVRFLDDDWAMNLVAVATAAESAAREGQLPLDAGLIVAATLIQHPQFVNISDELWDENAEFIAHARTDVPRLIAEIRRLRGYV